MNSIVMSNRCYDQLGNIHSAISTLRRYNHYLLFSVSEETFENQLLVEYFEKPLDDAIESKVEKILSVAAAKTVFDNPNIPLDRKPQLAIKNARDLREAMRYAKLEYHENNVSVQEYNRRKRAIPLVQRIAALEQIKKYAKEITVEILVSAIIGQYGGIAVWICQLVWILLPGKVRNQLIMKSKEYINNAVISLKSYSIELKSTIVGDSIVQLVKQLEEGFSPYMPYLQKELEKVMEKVQKVKDVAKSNLAP